MKIVEVRVRVVSEAAMEMCGARGCAARKTPKPTAREEAAVLENAGKNDGRSSGPVVCAVPTKPEIPIKIHGSYYLAQKGPQNARGM